MSRFIAIYHVPVCDITPDHPETGHTHNSNETPQPFCRGSPQSTITRPAAPRRAQSGRSTQVSGGRRSGISGGGPTGPKVPRRPSDIRAFGTSFLYRWQRRQSEALQDVWWHVESLVFLYSNQLIYVVLIVGCSMIVLCILLVLYIGGQETRINGACVSKRCACGIFRPIR